MGVGDTYYASKAGSTGNLAFTTAQGAATQVLTTFQKPLLLMLLSDQDVYLIQGDSSVAVTTSDFLLYANTYYPMLVESVYDSYLSARGSTASGTLVYTNVTDLTTDVVP